MDFVASNIPKSSVEEQKLGNEGIEGDQWEIGEETFDIEIEQESPGEEEEEEEVSTTTMKLSDHSTWYFAGGDGKRDIISPSRGDTEIEQEDPSHEEDEEKGEREKQRITHYMW